MRKVASYCLETVPSDLKPDALIGMVGAEVEGWLESKGTVHRGEAAASLELPDGRYADLIESTERVGEGGLDRWVLTEQTQSGQFRTTLQVAFLEDRVAVGCTLEVGGPGDALSPLFFDARTPHVVRRVINIPDVTWSFGAAVIPDGRQLFRGSSGGESFIATLIDPDRRLPVVAVSNDHGLLLHPGITDQIAYDLAGLAIVAELDSAASWQVTRSLGQEWSVFGGALRLYWPALKADQSAFRHQLWTPRSLLAGVSDTEAAAERIRRQLRRRILGLSAFSVFEPELVSKVRRVIRREELSRLRTRVEEEGSDYEAMAEEYFQRLVETTEAVDARDAEIQDLRRQLKNVQSALQWSPEVGVDEVAPEHEAPPATVTEAVSRARSQWKDRLLFGDNVGAGVQTLSPDAGPPDKVLSYLKALADLSEALSKGPLGQSLFEWLQSRGVTASGESLTTRSSSREMEKRTWHDGSGQRAFELHLKPNDGTSPDRCVRIYFDQLEAGGIVVGWVGRHP